MACQKKKLSYSGNCIQSTEPWACKTLKFDEAMLILKAVSDFHLKPSEKKPNFTILQNLSGHYNLCAKTNLIKQEYRSYIEEITKSRTLHIRESEGYLIIYGSSLERGFL